MLTKNNNNILMIVIVIMAVIIAVMWFFLWKMTSWTSDNPQVEKYDELSLKVLYDERDTQTDVDLIVDEITKLPSLSEADVEKLEFTKDNLSDYMIENNLSYLPAIIFSTNNFDVSNDPQQVTQNGQVAPKINSYLQALPSGEYDLPLGTTFDPFAEICDNGIDDNGDGAIDCEDNSCSKQLTCAEKVETPKAELFIMSYCPYGLQAQKWFLEAMLDLGEYADMEIKFVDYLMHGEKEWEENIAQYCIQEEQADKYQDYLKCFLDSWEIESCRAEALIDENALSSCIDNTKEMIDYENVIANSTSNYPAFNLHTDENTEYGVQGSPTFVLNGIKVDWAWRSAKAFADLICDSFIDKPEICDKDFNSTTYDPNFWFTSNGQNVAWACGG